MESIRKWEQGEAVPMDLLLLADPSEQKVKEYYQKGEMYIAEVNNHVVGVYVRIQINEITTELINIAVSEDWQGKGIGKRLVEHSLHTARQAGYKRIEVGTGNSSLDQLALYQKLGFRMEHIIKDYFAEYNQPIIENGIVCRDMVRLAQEL